MNELLKLLMDRDNQKDNPSLTKVLEDYAAATPDGNDFTVLEHWIKRYPQFAQELTNFAADRDLLEFAPTTEISQEEEQRHVELSHRTLKMFLARQKHEINSLTALAKEKGLKKQEFASRLGLSVSLLMYLEKRRLEFSTIPKKIIARIADFLQVTEEAIENYLNQSPDYGLNASFKAQVRPELVKPKSFTAAVHEDQTLTEKEKQTLLNL